MTGGTLVTGAAGFVGSWLVPALQAAGERVIGAGLPGSSPPRAPDEWVELDLLDFARLRRMLSDKRPDRIVHLAALASPVLAAREPLAALRSNYRIVDGLLRAARDGAPDARLLLVSSGEVYGYRPPHSPPHAETGPTNPHTLYAATRVAAERRAQLAQAQDGLDVVLVRPFNHTGPGRGRDYAESSFALQLARIERGQQAPRLRVGNLEARRDYSDVRDVVEAYRLLLERAESGGVYNVASGRARSLRSVLERLIQCSTVRPEVTVDPELYRPHADDRTESCGDPRRLRELGWSPRYALEDTLDELLDDWRSRG